MKEKSIHETRFSLVKDLILGYRLVNSARCNKRSSFCREERRECDSFSEKSATVPLPSLRRGGPSTRTRVNIEEPVAMSQAIKSSACNLMDICSGQDSSLLSEILSPSRVRVSAVRPYVLIASSCRFVAPTRPISASRSMLRRKTTFILVQCCG